MESPSHLPQQPQILSKSPNYIQKPPKTNNIITSITNKNQIVIPIQFLNESFDSSLSLNTTHSSLNINLTKPEKELKEEIERVTKLIEEKEKAIINYQSLIKEVTI